MFPGGFSRNFITLVRHSFAVTLVLNISHGDLIIFDISV